MHMYLRDGSFGYWLTHLFVPVNGAGWDEWIGRWVAALATLAIFSFVWRDNRGYKLAENVFIGVATGYEICRKFQDVVVKKVYTPLLDPPAGTASDGWLWIPLVLGLLTMTKLIPNISWFSRWPVAFVAGVTMGLAIITNLQSNITEQVEATIRPFRYIDEAWATKHWKLTSPDDEARLKGDALEARLLEKRVAIAEGVVLLAKADGAEKVRAMGPARVKAELAFLDQPYAPVGAVLELAREKVGPQLATIKASTLKMLQEVTGADPATRPAREAEYRKHYGKWLPADADLTKVAENEATMDRLTAVDVALQKGLLPEAHSTSGTQWSTIINAILLALGVLTGLVYFFFSKEHTGLVFGGMARLGIWFLMISFGSSFGYTIMARMSLLIGRMQFLMGDWLHLSADLSGFVPSF